MKYVLAFVLMLSASVNAAMAADAAPAPVPNAQKAVLVTGASTGIGRKVTERLAREGYFVYAGARKEQDLKDLDDIPNVHALRLDVTSADDIAAAVDAVTHAGRGLYALVNNAGVVIVGPLAETKEEDFNFLMNVNLYGPYRMTKAFSPLIVAAKGRITTIGSISGILTARNLGAYSISKHGIEAFSDVLAAEMAPVGVAVSVVEPGNYNSEIARSAAKRTGATGLTDRSQYREPDEVAAGVLAVGNVVGLLARPEPHVVVEAGRHLGLRNRAAGRVAADAALDCLHLADPTVADEFAGQPEAPVRALLAPGCDHPAGLLGDDDHR